MLIKRIDPNFYIYDITLSYENTNHNNYNNQNSEFEKLKNEVIDQQEQFKKEPSYQSRESSLNKIVESIFDNEDKCKEMTTLSNTLQLSEWDLSCFQNTTLKDFIYIKFNEIIYNYHKSHSFTKEEEEIVYNFLASFYLSKPNIKSPSFNKLRFFKEDLSFYILEKLCQTSPEMLSLTLKEISEKKKVEEKENKPEIAKKNLEVHKNAFFLIDLAFKNVLANLDIISKVQKKFLSEVVESNLKNLNKKGGKNSHVVVNSQNKNVLKNDPRFTDIEEFQRHFESLKRLQEHQYQPLLEDWKRVTTSNNQTRQFEFNINHLQNQLLSYQKFIKDKLELLKTKVNHFKNQIEYLLPVKKKNEFDEKESIVLNSKKSEQFQLEIIESDKSSLPELANKINSLTELTKTLEECNKSFKDLTKVIEKTNHKRQKRKLEIQGRLKKMMPSNQFERVQENVPGRIDKLSTITNSIDRLCTIIDAYTKHSLYDLKSISSSFSTESNSDLADTRNGWDLDQEWMKSTQKNKIKKEKKKTSPTKNELTQNHNKVEELEKKIESFSISEEGMTTSFEEIVQNKLTTILSENDILNLSPSSLRVIQEMNSLLQTSVQSRFGNDLDEFEEKILKETLSHLFLWGCDLNLLIQALSKNDFESLGSIIPMLFLNMHTVFEQFLQREYVIQHGEMFTDNHRLTELLERTTQTEDVNEYVKEFIKKIDAASLWTRYVKYYEKRYPNENNRPKLLNAMILAINISKSFQQGSVKLSEVHATKLINLTKYVFDMTKTAYKCLFVCIEKDNDLVVSQTTQKNWNDFLNITHNAIEEHLKKQLDKTINKEIPSSLKNSSEKIRKILYSMDQKISECSCTQFMEFGDPILPITEAYQQIVRLLAAMKISCNYTDPIFTATHVRNQLAMQWIIEQLLKALSISSQIPPLLTHNFVESQRLIIETRLLNNTTLTNFKVKDNEKKNLKANEFNCNIGFNYPHLYKGENKWLSEFIDMLEKSQKSMDTGEMERRKPDEEMLNNLVSEVIKVLEVQVDETLMGLSMAKESFYKI